MRRSRVKSYFFISEVVLSVDVRLMSLLGVDLGQKVDFDRYTSTVHVSLKQGDLGDNGCHSVSGTNLTHGPCWH
jgi:hypothetical protein